MYSDGANKNLAKAKRSQSGWTASDVLRLYEGFGFTIRRGKHDVVSHPDHKQLRASVTRSSGAIGPTYVTTAIQLIEELLRVEGD